MSGDWFRDDTGFNEETRALLAMKELRAVERMYQGSTLSPQASRQRLGAQERLFRRLFWRRARQAVWYLLEGAMVGLTVMFTAAVLVLVLWLLLVAR